MPTITADVEIDYSDLFGAVDPGDAIDHFGSDAFLDEIPIEKVIEFAAENARHTDILRELDEDAVIKFLKDRGFKVEDPE